MKRRTTWILALLAVVTVGGYAYHRVTENDAPPSVSKVKVTRGDVVESVSATGQLQAVTTVQVGSQVSGTVAQLNADFNSLVHKGEVIARLDPSLFQTQIDQARANLVKSQADLERLRVAVDDASAKLQRAEQLAKASLIAQMDLEDAQVTARSAEAQLRAQEAAVNQAQASLDQNTVSLEHTVIVAPIDGLVISRNVDVGQTVAASMSAPVLFVLAADLTEMQVIADLDESDVGRIRPGQAVTFRVDAYPNDQFRGQVSQLRLQPTTVQNVVTYSTVIDVPNPDLKLKPGMTANVTIEIMRRENVLRLPNSALRFRPTAETFAALGQQPPAGSGGRGRGTNVPTEVLDASASSNEEARLANAIASGPGAVTTIDALFGPLPPTESSGQAWLFRDGKLARVGLRLGTSDRQQTELIEGDLKEGDEVVTAVTSGQRIGTNTGSTSFPGFQPQGRGGFGGGFPGGR